MATRSIISIKLENDEYKAIYCHHDGYLTHNGAFTVRSLQYTRKS